jgi:hypothetical protein
LLEQSDNPQRQRGFREKVAAFAANFQPLYDLPLTNVAAGSEPGKRE